MSGQGWFWKHLEEAGRVERSRARRKLEEPVQEVA